MTHPLTSALAMRTAAATVAHDKNACCPDCAEQAASAIRALPLEADRAALLAEAVNLAEVQALIEASKAFRFAALTGGKSFGVYTALNDALTALETP